MPSKNIESWNPGGMQQFLINSARQQKSLVGHMYWRVLSEVAINRFDWQNMPKEISVRFLEHTLHFNGLAVFFKDYEYDRYFALRASGAGQINFYDNPTRFMVYGNGMYGSKELTARECVPIYPNFMRLPDAQIVQVFANKLAQVDRTIDINLLQQRRPFVATVPEEKRLTAQNFYKNVEDGAAIIWGTDGLDINSEIQVFNLGVDKDLVLNTIIAKQKIWNECMTMLGINNANQDKKERLVSDEVAANDDQVLSNRNSATSAREQAADEINEMFGLDIKVVWRNENGADMNSMGSDMYSMPSYQPESTPDKSTN